MTPRSPLLQLGKIVAKDMARGGRSQGLQGIGEALASRPESVMEIMDLLFVEVRKKRPDPELTSAFLFMLQQALEATRWRIENQSTEPTELIDSLRSRIARAASSDQLPSELLMRLAQCFAAAKLDIGDDVRRVLGNSIQRLAGGQKAMSYGGDLESHLGRLADDLEHDPFLIQSKMAETFAGLPVEQRIELISILVFSGVPSLREASVGWLLDPDASITGAVAGFLAQAADRGMVSGLTINRLIVMRNWIHDDRRSAVDATIRAARQQAGTLTAVAASQIGKVSVSSCDGAGAQSIFVVTKQKRKFSVACLLIKHGFGIRDAWVAHGITGSEVESLLGQVRFELGGWDSSIDVVQTALAHGLAVNSQENLPIPFALLQFIEAIGLPAMTPAYMQPEELVGRLFEEIPVDKRNQAAILRALAASKHWSKEFVWINSWFEDGEAVVAAARAERTTKTCTEVVLKSVVTDRRKRWAELLAWNALAARDDDDTDDWIDFTLVAQQLLGDCAIGDIPLAVTIAKNSVGAIKDRF